MNSKIIPRDTLYYHPKNKEIINKMNIALEYFPEISQIAIGVYGRGGGSWCSACACYNTTPYEIKIHIKLLPSMNVFFHELGHILQFLHIVPHGEESASIFGLARMPLELTESSYIPYIGYVPKLHIQSLCKDAIKERDAGRTKYIMWMKDQIKKLQLKSNWDITTYNDQILDVDFYTKGRYIYASGFDDVEKNNKKSISYIQTRLTGL